MARLRSSGKRCSGKSWTVGEEVHLASDKTINARVLDAFALCESVELFAIRTMRYTLCGIRSGISR